MAKAFLKAMNPGIDPVLPKVKLPPINLKLKYLFFSVPVIL